MALESKYNSPQEFYVRVLSCGAGRSELLGGCLIWLPGILPPTPFQFRGYLHPILWGYSTTPQTPSHGLEPWRARNSRRSTYSAGTDTRAFLELMNYSGPCPLLGM